MANNLGKCETGSSQFVTSGQAACVPSFGSRLVNRQTKINIRSIGKAHNDSKGTWTQRMGFEFRWWSLDKCGTTPREVQITRLGVSMSNEFSGRLSLTLPNLGANREGLRGEVIWKVSAIDGVVGSHPGQRLRGSFEDFTACTPLFSVVQNHVQNSR